MSVDFHRVLRRPVVTEKTTQLKEGKNQVIFEVDSSASKPMIKEAVEKAFKTKVTSVNTMRVRGKLKRMGRFEGRKPNWKKAVVTLAEGENIELVEGV